MDDTQMSRVSDAAAAATRKRRSSILKSQRPPRTPFSELEFNVATPTDTAKSRRVSFSRRTGVAEFATNEATTTWKNFYEEHNRSLESSGNDCASKQIGHIGKRIFDQQFEVVEDDFDGIHEPGHMNKSLSLNTFNHQLLSFDRTEELKLSGNHSIMHLSTFTNTNPFSEPAMPGGEVTDRININFSDVQTIGNDDLDDIEHDLKLNTQGAFKRQNMSEYIQVDLDMTQAALCNDDMSITDTVHSPEVHVPKNVRNSDGNLNLGQCDDLDEIQRDLNKKYGREMSMSQSLNSLKGLDPKTKLVDGSCEVDKENIVLNPYAPLRETENFAVNDEVDKVLVFDGKRLTLQADKAQDEPPPPKPIENAQRKTIVLNFNDDLPNFVDVPIAHTTGMIEVTQLKKNLVLENMPTTVEPVLDTNNRSFIYDENQGNIITQVVANNIVSEDKRRTIHYDDSAGNISMTQALPTKIAEKRRTIVYDDEEGDMSITRVFPTNFLSTNVENEKRKTIVFNDGNMSMTQAIPSNIVPEKTTKRSNFVEDSQDILNITSNEAQKQKTEKSKVFSEEDYCNFSVAQAIPSINTIASKQSSDRRRTVVFEADTGNISVTQVVPSVIIHEIVQESNIVAAENKIIESQSEKVRRRTIVYDNDTGDLSITQSVPNHVIKTNLFQPLSLQNVLSTECASNDVTHTTDSENNKRKTIVFDNDDADISITQAVSVNQVLCAMRDENKDSTTKSENASNEVTNAVNSDTNKRKTIVFDNDDADISITQAVSVNQVLCAMRDENKDQTTKCEGESNEVTNTANSDTNKRTTIVFDNDDADISMTEDVSVNQVLCAMRNENKDQATKSEDASNTANSDTNKRKTIVFDNDDADISITQAVSVNQVLCAMRDENKDSTTKSEGAVNEVTNTANSANKRKTIVFDNDDANISMTQAVSVNQVLCVMRNKNKNQTINTVNETYPEPNVQKSFVFNNVFADIPKITQAVPTNVIECFNFSINDKPNKATNSNNCEKGRTVVLEHEEGDISMTQDVNIKTIVQKPNVLHGQDGRNVQEDFVLEALHNKKGKGHRTIIYEKEYDNLSISVNQQSDMEHAPFTSMKANILEQRNSIFGDVTSAADSLAENNYENKQLNDPDGSKMLNIPMMPTIDPDNNENVDTEKRFDMSSRNEIKKVIRKAFSPEVQSITSGTNLQSLTKIQNDLEKSIRNEMTNVIRENYDEAAVFQTALSLLTDKGNTKSTNYEATFHEKLSSSSKVYNDDELKQTNEVSSDMHSEKMYNIGTQNENKVKAPRKIPNDITSIYHDSEKTSEKSKSIINDLLDMSSSVDEIRQAGQPKGENKKIAENDSDEGEVFLITHDQKETKSQTDATDDTPQLIVVSPLPLEFRNNSSNKSQPLSQKIQNKLHNIKDVLVKSTNKTFDKLTPILKGKSKEDRTKSAPVTIRGHLALENKCEAELEAKQSFVPRRQSTLNREDLLNNLSKAGEVLQTQTYFDDEDLDDSQESKNSPINNVRISNEVVKTLQFDESANETNLFQKLSSPLQKSAFSETSYVNDYKSTVIPQFTTVSDGIKELMDDLVKPNSDVLPYDCSLANKATNKVSTHSTEIQANLVTSSQVELTGFISESICNLNLNRISSNGIINEAVNRSFTRALKTPIRSFTATASDTISERSIVNKSVRTKSPTKRIESPSRVLVFDHFNPLNNILLAPKILQEAHAYNPVQFEEGTESESNSAQISLYDRNVESSENVTLQYNVSNVTHCLKQSGDTTLNRSNFDTLPKLSSRISLVSKPPSFDRSFEALNEKDLKSARVNTLIAMKGNLELLEAHSSLTLVDDTLAHSSSDETKSPKPKSAMKVLYSSYTRDDVLRDIESELASVEVIRKSKKRGRDNPKQISNRRSVNGSFTQKQELTPKPNKKIPKLSEIPYTMKPIQLQHVSENVSVKNEKIRPMQSEHVSENVSVKSEMCKKMADNVFMQKLVTEYKVKPISPVTVQEKVETLDTYKSGVSSLEPSLTASQSRSDDTMDADSSEKESSCTSSKNLRDDATQSDSNSSKVSKMDLQPNVPGNEMKEVESGDNVVAMIEKMKFMGSECEWECRADDMWSFRMLHRRIRLMLRLKQFRDGMGQRADAFVQHISVEIVQHDSKNLLAAMCVRFAADTMQWFVNRGCRTARGVPTLLRQCAAVARLAARWGRFMSEARHHLAYTLTPQGLVTLKVANIPLRCVWEVSLQLRLSRTSGSAAPWVEASDVTVRRVMSCAPPRSNDDPAPLLRDLPRDWSHAPRAIWKLFKHFKHMTRKEDDELFMV